MDPTKRYLDLVSRVDVQSTSLKELHGRDITCRPGCTSCCRNLSVFPVEFHAIKQAMTRAGMGTGTLTFDPSARCGFLHGGLCRIYRFRPIICRTHGLPILFLDEASGEFTWEVSFCELNFEGHERIEFTDDTLLNIEEINEELSRTNHDFIVSKGRRHQMNPVRIALKNLCDQSTSTESMY